MWERYNWFNQKGEKERLMSEVFKNAQVMVEDLKNVNFRYGSGLEQGIKKEFYWTEFLPKEEENKKLLTKQDVLEALGIGPNPRIEEAKKDRNMPNGDIVGIWPTSVPDLSYILIKSAGSTTEEDYFQIEENLPPLTNR